MFWLCRFLFGIGDLDSSDEIPVDHDGLLFRSRAGNLLRLHDLDLLHEGADDLRSQFCDICVLPYHIEEGVYTQALLLGGSNESVQFNLSALKLSLLILIGLGHPSEPFIADLAIHVILVEALHNHIKFLDSCLGLRQFPVAVPKLSVQLLLALPCHQLHEVILMLMGISGDPPQFPEQDFFHLHIVYLVRGAAARHTPPKPEPPVDGPVPPSPIPKSAAGCGIHRIPVPSLSLRLTYYYLRYVLERMSTIPLFARDSSSIFEDLMPWSSQLQDAIRSYEKEKGKV